MPGPKPFSLAVGAEGGSAWIRVAFLDDRLTQTFSDHLWSAPTQSLPLRSGPAKIAQVLELSHPLSGQVLWDELLGAKPSDDLPLEFLTPVFFRRRGFNYPLPEPGLVLASLIARWNAYAPEPVPEGVAATLLRGTTVRFLKGYTKGAMAHDRTVGFLGRVTYHLPGANNEEAAWLARLGKLAFFAGVGTRTTLGFGLTAAYQPRAGSRGRTAVNSKGDGSSGRSRPSRQA